METSSDSNAALPSAGKRADFLAGVAVIAGEIVEAARGACRAGRCQITPCMIEDLMLSCASDMKLLALFSVKQASQDVAANTEARSVMPSSTGRKSAAPQILPMLSVTARGTATLSNLVGRKRLPHLLPAAGGSACPTYMRQDRRRSRSTN
jgi:hypothetical protein